MFLLANFIVGLAAVLKICLNIYMWIIIVRALISWVNPDPYNPIVQFLHRATDPVLYFIRRKIPFRTGMIDISPIIAILIIVFLQYFVVESLYQLAARIR